MEKNKAGQEERQYWVCGWGCNITSALPNYAGKGRWRLGPRWQWRRWWNVVGTWVSFCKSWRRPGIGPCRYPEEENFGRGHWKCKGPKAGVNPDVQEAVRKDRRGWSKARGKERGMPHVLGWGSTECIRPRGIFVQIFLAFSLSEKWFWAEEKLNLTGSFRVLSWD